MPDYVLDFASKLRTETESSELCVFPELESGMRERLLSLEPDDPWEFNPRLVGPLLDAGEDLLAGCMDLRAEALELEADAFEFLVQTWLNEELEALEEEEVSAGVDLARETALKGEFESSARAAKHFDAAHQGEGDDDWREGWLGFKGLASSREESSRAELQVERELSERKVRQKRRLAARRARQLLRDRARQAGTAHDFMGRYEAARRLFVRDLTEAFIRLASASDGLKAVYKIDDVPIREAIANPEHSMLDSVLDWTRSARDKLDRILQNDQVFEVPIMLVRSGAMSEDRLESGQSSGCFYFDLGEEFFPYFTLPRIRGLTLSVIDGRANKDAHRSYRDTFSGTVRLPIQKDSNDSDIDCAHRHIPVSNVRDDRAYAEQSRTEGYVGFNADPRGPWCIHIPEAQSQNNQTNRRDIREFKLTLRIASVVKASTCGQE